MNCNLFIRIVNEESCMHFQKGKKYELWFIRHNRYVMNENTRLQYLRTLFSFGRLNKYLRRLNTNWRSLRHPLPQNSAPPVLKIALILRLDVTL